MKIILLNILLITSLLSNSLMFKYSVKTISTLMKNEKSLVDEEIISLSQISDSINGTKKINKYIGSLNLSQNVREDIYLRIAIYQNKLTRQDAEVMLQNLKGVEGFSSTLSKIIGNNPSGTLGHLNELRIANTAVQRGFKVIAIGKKFDDGIKGQLTDIDVLLSKNGRDILIEAKNYKSTTKMDLIKYRADLDTLNIYNTNVSDGKSLKIFTFTKEPESSELLKQYQFWANKKGIQLIFGSPEEQIEQIKMLERIL